jgi:SAM-dependent methyltransferase
MKNYLKIAEHYDKCFQEHGDNHLGVDWPNEQDAKTRYQVMLDMVKENTPVSLLDFGCGTAAFYQYLIDTDQYQGIKYSGLDINKSFCDASKEKFTDSEFYNKDILEDPEIPSFDYIVCNGTFTEKLDLSQDEMMDFFTSAVTNLWGKCNRGIAFNLMSKHVDWERKDLFHVSLDELGWFLKENLSRNFVIRNDYRLYEYTVYVYKN